MASKFPVLLMCCLLAGSIELPCAVEGAGNIMMHYRRKGALRHRRHFQQGNASAVVGVKHEGKERKGPFEYRMRYMPRHKLVVCACAKCGSSSMYEFIYEQEFGRHWPYKGQPFAQTTDSSRWETRFEKVEPVDQAQVFAEAFSFALVRDPVDRLISAWKSKVACDENHTGVDKQDRSRMVPALLSLIEEDSRGDDCLSLDDFARALYIAHKKGKAAELNVHFLPQDKACFAKFPASNWSKVVAISENGSLDELAFRLKDGRHQLQKKRSAPPPKLHSSSSSKMSHSTISTDTSSMLAAVTASEYQMLGTYLPSFN